MICPKCKAVSGDDWSRCNGSCPFTESPHYNRQPILSGAIVIFKAEAKNPFAPQYIVIHVWADLAWISVPGFNHVTNVDSLMWAPGLKTKPNLKLVED